VNELKKIINDAFENHNQIQARNASNALQDAIRDTLSLLELGQVRIAEKYNGVWTVNTWLKKAVLLSFKINESTIIRNGHTNYFDKIPSKYLTYQEKDFMDAGVRVVPPATARYGTYIAHGVVLMPSFVNIGAYIDSGTMVDTWATVGSCAQIGKNVHLSGGVGIGGVLEPLQARPTIIEDDCFIGARSEIVEGVVVERGSVISMGVYIGQSTKIYNRMTKEIIYGHIPSGSVVVPGVLPAADGSHSIYCAIIVKQVDKKTNSRVSLNELLRDY
jgi:2,3,4,5-tetrahydropyridine-2-carboxylate N-succinyltransferase